MELIHKVVSRWIKMAKCGNYKDIIIDTVKKSYSDKYLKRIRFFYLIFGRVGKPKDFSRFLIQANSCIHHNSYEELNKIKCKTLVIRGDCDKIVGSNSSLEISKSIKDCKVFIYQGLGHAVYEEAKDFNKRVLEFMVSDK